MNRYGIIVSLFVTLIAVKMANATLITFDEEIAHNDSTTSFTHTDNGVTEVVRYTPLNVQYQDYGVTFGGDWLVVDNDGTFGESPLSGDGFAAFNQSNSLNMSFGTAINSISGYLGGGLVDCCYESMIWEISAFFDNQLIGSKSITSTASPSGGGFSFFQLDFENADYVEISAIPENPALRNQRYGGILENLSFNTNNAVQVSEPAILNIFLLLALYLTFRSNKQSH